MTERHSGARQKDILVVLKQRGPTLSGPQIYELVAKHMGRSDPPSRTLKTQLRKSLDGLCLPSESGDPQLLQKTRRGGTNYFTLIEHTLTHEQIDAEERELVKALHGKAANLVLIGDETSLTLVRRELLEAVTLLTWKRVKCSAGESIDTRTDVIDENYLLVRTGMSAEDLHAYLRSEASRMVKGAPWEPMRLIR